MKDSASLMVKAGGFWKEATTDLERLPDVSLDVSPDDELARLVSGLTSSVRAAIWKHVHGTDFYDAKRDVALAMCEEDEAAT